MRQVFYLILATIVFAFVVTQTILRMPAFQKRHPFFQWEGDFITGSWRPCLLTDGAGWKMYVDRKLNSVIVAAPWGMPPAGRVWWEESGKRLIVHSDGAGNSVAIDIPTNKLIVVGNNGVMTVVPHSCDVSVLWPDGSAAGRDSSISIAKLYYQQCGEDLVTAILEGQ